MVGTVLLCLLAVYGTVELLVRFSRWLWLPKRLHYIAVVPLGPDGQQPEQTLHRTTEELLRDRGCAQVCFVDVGLPPEMRALCDKLAQTGEYAAVISWDKLHEKLQFMQK